jgi:AAA+ superfamily predicted ATPase
MKNFRQPTGWRDEAIDGAIRAFATSDGTGTDLVYVYVREHLPGSITYCRDIDRQKLIQFLRAEADQMRSLISGSANTFGYRDEPAPSVYFAWYSVEWRGRRIEIAMPPDHGSDGTAIFVGDDNESLFAFVEQATEYSIRPQGRALCYSDGWESAPDIDAEIGSITWDDIVLSKGLVEEVRSAIDGFLSNREVYKTLGFPWRRGILLVGPPGTGKTMICKAAASGTSVPYLYVRDLREHGHSSAIHTIFERARKLSPCILVFEDMDGFVNESNRTVFLNEMDGFGSNDGLLILASSNHPERIDDALLKRPSRFDRVFHVSLPDFAERREYCRRLIERSQLGKHVAQGVDRNGLVDRIAERTEGFTPAYLKEVFVSAALASAHEGRSTLDQDFVTAALRQVDEFRAFLKKAQNPESLGELTNGAKMGLRV